MNQFFMFLVKKFIKTGKLFVFLVKFIIKLTNISFSLVSRPAWVITSEFEAVMVVDSVEILSFLVETDCVLVEGDIIRNKDFVGIVEFFEI